MMLTTLLAALLALNAPAASCTAADPAIVQTAVRSVTQNGDLNHYVVAVTVTNLGRGSQAGNTLQSVAVYQDNDKVDQKGLPPLRPGQSVTVTYAFDRSRLAREGTTDLTFRLVFKAAVDCNDANDEAHIRV